MKRFKFQLAAVLKVAQLKKDRAEIAFAEAVEKLKREEEILKGYEEELKAAYEDYNLLTAPNKNITAAELIMYSRYFARLKSQMERQRQKIAAAEKNRQEKLKILRDEMNHLKTIEKLKEKRRQEFMAAELAEEQKNLDEIGLQIYVRTAR
jgi:flagellar FliJ protein